MPRCVVPHKVLAHRVSYSRTPPCRRSLGAAPLRQGGWLLYCFYDGLEEYQRLGLEGALRTPGCPSEEEERSCEAVMQ